MPINSPALRRPWWLAFPALLLGLLAAGPLACAGADDEADKDAAKEAAAEGKDEAEEKDPYKVPEEGTAEEYLTFIQEAVQTGPSTEEDRDRMLAAIIGASEKILALEDADEASQLEAIQWKFRVLNLQVRLQSEGAQEKLNAFVAELKKDERPGVQELLREIEMAQRLAKLQQAEGEELTQLAEAFLTELTEGEASREQLMLGMQVARVLEYRDEAKLAGKTYETLAELARKSDDEAIQEYALKFEGSARRVQLPGNEIELAGQTLDGKSFNIKDLRGKVVLVDFWATWCGPCIAEMPNVKSNYKRYHDKGFEVVGISLDDSVEDLEEFIKENEIPWTTLFNRDNPEQQGWDHPAAVHYGISGIPTVILVDAEGKVVSLNARGEALGEHLRELLGPPADDEGNTEKPTEEKTEAEKE